MLDPQPILNVVVPSVVGGVAGGFMIWVFWQIIKAWWRNNRK